MKKWLVILISGLWIAAVHAEKAYKWVDAEGNVQITQTPPPTGAKDLKQMDLPKALMPNTPPQIPQIASEKKEEKIEEKSKQPPVDISKMTPQQLHEHNCSGAKRHLELLKSNEKVAIPDKDNANKLQLISDEQRNAEIKKAEGLVDKFCNAPIPTTPAQPQNPAEKKPDEGGDKKPESKPETTDKK